MKIFKKRNSAFKIIDNKILNYDVRDSEIDFTSEGKLCAVTIDDVKEIEELLGIDAIEDYVVEIIDENIEICDYICDII